MYVEAITFLPFDKVIKHNFMKKLITAMFLLNELSFNKTPFLLKNENLPSEITSKKILPSKNRATQIFPLNGCHRSVHLLEYLSPDISSFKLIGFKLLIM